jgi:hypothetical protein
MGPTRQPPRPNNGTAMPTAAATALPPPVSPPPPPQTQLTPPLPTSSAGYKSSTPPPVEQPFFLLHTLRRHCAAVLAVVEPLLTAALVPLRTPRHHPELCTDAVNSLDPLIGTLDCFSGRSPVHTCNPSTSPLLASMVRLPLLPKPERSPHRAPRPLPLVLASGRKAHVGWAVASQVGRKPL